MSRRLAKALVALVALALFTTALPHGAEAAAKLRKVKVGYIKIGALTDVWVAQQKGFFKKQGLDATITEYQTADIIPALASGAVDIALQIPGTAVSANEAGLDLVALLQNETANTKAPASNAIMVKPGSAIKTIADLKGKTIGVGTVRGQGTAVLKQLLQDNGLKVSDVTLTEVPFFQMPAVLRAGKVDAVVALDPFTSQIRSTGIGVVLSYYMIAVLPDQPVGAWFSKRSYATSHVPEITAFDAALVAAMDYLKADVLNGRDLVAEFAGLNPDLVKSMPLIAWRPIASRAKWQKVFEIMVKQGDLKKVPDLNKLFAAPMLKYTSK